jgi:hypothetical protein
MNPPEAFLVMNSFRNNVDPDELVGKNQEFYRVYSSETSLDGTELSRPRRTDDDPPPSPIAAADAVSAQLGTYLRPNRIKSLIEDHPTFHVGQSLKHPQCPRCNPPIVPEETEESPYPATRRESRPDDGDYPLYLFIKDVRIYVGFFHSKAERRYARASAVSLVGAKFIRTNRIPSEDRGDSLDPDRKEEILNDVIFYLNRAGLGSAKTTSSEK